MRKSTVPRCLSRKLERGRASGAGTQPCKATASESEVTEYCQGYCTSTVEHGCTQTTASSATGSSAPICSFPWITAVAFLCVPASRRELAVEHPLLTRRMRRTARFRKQTARSGRQQLRLRTVSARCSNPTSLAAIGRAAGPTSPCAGCASSATYRAAISRWGQSPAWRPRTGCGTPLSTGCRRARRCPRPACRPR